MNAHTSIIHLKSKSSENVENNFNKIKKRQSQRTIKTLNITHKNFITTTPQLSYFDNVVIKNVH